MVGYWSVRAAASHLYISWVCVLWVCAADAKAVVFRAMDLMKIGLPALLLNMLKCIKQVSMDTNTLAPLQRAGAIPKLINLFTTKQTSTEVQKVRYAKQFTHMIVHICGAVRAWCAMRRGYRLSCF